MALAMEWVSKITTVGLMMVLPAVGGMYLDSWLGTKYWVLVGMTVGMVAGFAHLLNITRRPPNSPQAVDKSGKESQDSFVERSGEH